MDVDASNLTSTSAMIDNNAFEIIPSPRNKRKISAPNPNVYMNPALDLLVTEDKICNTTMEITPAKRLRRSKSCNDSSAFENPCLMKESSANNLLAKDLWNVKHNIPAPVIQNCNVQNVVVTSPNLSFIERLVLNSPECSSSSLYLDDDLNESNIMEIKSISTNPFINCSIRSDETDTAALETTNFPFDVSVSISEEIPYIDQSDLSDANRFAAVSRRLFTSEITESTINLSSEQSAELPSILKKPIDALNKPSKILGCDITMFAESDIMNIGNKLTKRGNVMRSSKRKFVLKPALKASNTLSKKMFKKLKHAFKHEKEDTSASVSGNPYEVPRKTVKAKEKPNESCFENPALALDCSDVNIEEVDTDNDSNSNDNRFSNVNETPPRKMTFTFKCNKDQYLRDIGNLYDSSIDAQTSVLNKKRVRFDSTLNQEKVITGDSFDSIGLDYSIPQCDDSTTIAIGEMNTELEEFHDELENCLNERKFLKQNL